MLYEDAKAKRLARCPDKKIFTVDAKVKQKNDHWFVNYTKDVPIVAQTNFFTSA